MSDRYIFVMLALLNSYAIYREFKANKELSESELYRKQRFSVGLLAVGIVVIPVLFLTVDRVIMSQVVDVFVRLNLALVSIYVAYILIVNKVPKWWF